MISAACSRAIKATIVFATCIAGVAANGANIQNCGVVAISKYPTSQSSSVAFTHLAVNNGSALAVGVWNTLPQYGVAAFSASFAPDGSLQNSIVNFGGYVATSLTPDALVTAPGGNFYMAGHLVQAGLDLILQKYDTKGKVIVGTSYDSGQPDVTAGMGVDSSSNVYVLDQFYATIPQIIKFDSSLSKHTTVSLPMATTVAGFSVSASGDCTVAANTVGGPYVARYTGATQDFNTAITGMSGLSLKGMAVDSTGDVLVTGSFTSGSVQTGIVICLNSQGQTLWSQPLTVANSTSEGDFVAFDPKFNVIVVGLEANGKKPGIWRFNSGGTQLWHQEFAGINASYTLTAPSGLALDQYGDSYICGTSSASLITTGFLLKYNTAGQQMFLGYQGVSGSSTNYNSMQLDANNDIYIGGYLYNFSQQANSQGVVAHWAQAAICNNDSYKATKNTTLTVAAPGVLTNDYFTHGATGTAATKPTHGTVNLSASGGFTYTPNSAFVGTDTFQYQAAKLAGGGQSNVATVTITVG
jgi:hypothetical protein